MSRGRRVRQCDYLPFGQEWQCAGVDDPRTFAGMEKAPGIGGGAWSALNYAGARYYHSQTGRFTSVDPIVDIQSSLGIPQRWNRYAYSRNNPLRYVDPDGRYEEDVHRQLTQALAMAAGIINPYACFAASG